MLARPASIASLVAPDVANVRRVKAALFVASLYPLAYLVWLGLTGGLGADPVEFIRRSTGTWTLDFLVITLSVTPLRRATGWHWLVRLRRMFGLYAFFYATIHVVTYFWLDQLFDLAAIWRDVLKRPLITIGFLSFVLMIPLAVTSTDRMARWLGGKRWQQLHRAVYLVAIAGVVHFWWLVKLDYTRP
ncbi:MAG: sulfite oxidase heme-binding subunit YedZ, partial [Terriglobia bacterium]